MRTPSVQCYLLCSLYPSAALAVMQVARMRVLCMLILPNTHRFGYSMHDATHKFTFVYFSRTAQTEFIPSHQIWWPPGGYLPVVLLHSYGQQHNTDCPAGRELAHRIVCVRDDDDAAAAVADGQRRRHCTHEIATASQIGETTSE